MRSPGSSAAFKNTSPAPHTHTRKAHPSPPHEKPINSSLDQPFTSLSCQPTSLSACQPKKHTSPSAHQPRKPTSLKGQPPQKTMMRFSPMQYQFFIPLARQPFNPEIHHPKCSPALRPSSSPARHPIKVPVLQFPSSRAQQGSSLAVLGPAVLAEPPRVTEKHEFPSLAELG